MAVTYKGAYSIKGVVRHGETVQGPVGPQSVDLGDYENGETINRDLLTYFSRAYDTYILTFGDEIIQDGVLTSVATGSAGNYTRQFVLSGTDDAGTENINFTYYVVPVHGTQPNYVVDYDAYAAIFSPKWTEQRTLLTISSGGNPFESPFAFNEELILDGEFPGPQDDYTWSGMLPDGLNLSADGIVTGSLSATEDTDFGTWDVTVTSTFGDTATLQINVMVYVLS